jgi:HEAT repeat protein
MIRTVVSLADGGRPEFARALAELPRPVASRLAALLETEGVIERWLAEPVRAEREEVVAAVLARAAEVGVIRSLLDALESTDESVRIRCAAALSKSHDENAIGSLAALLDDSSSAVRAEAVGSIARLGGPAALDPLCRAAADPDLGVRSAAASGFRSVFAQRSSWSMAALPPDLDLDSSLSESRRALLTLTSDSDSTVRSEAAGACAYIGSPEVAEALVQLALEDADQAVRGVSAGALAQCGFAHSRRLLAAALEDADDIRRERAMFVLGRLGGAEAARHLAEALNDHSARVREAAAAALARVDAAGIADQLIAHLRNPDPRVRARAAAELGRSGAVKSVDALVQALSDPEENVRVNALHALGEFGRAVRRHEQSLRDRESDPSDHVRNAASAALGRLRETWAEAPEAADLARRGRLSDAGVEEVVEAAASGDLDPLLNGLDHRRSARRIAAFFAESDGDRLPLVLAVLRNARAADRERAASSFSEALRNGISADRYIDALRALDADVRLMGVEIIGRVGTPTAVQALLEVLAHDPLSEVRSRAASALAETPREAARAGLQRAVREDPDRIVRSAAGRALEQMREASEVRHSVPTSADETAHSDDTQAL